jgi:transposase InsO family protein
LKHGLPVAGNARARDFTPMAPNRVWASDITYLWTDEGRLMSRKGNCWDGALTESWFNRFKNERVHGVRHPTHADIKAAAFEYIES